MANRLTPEQIAALSPREKAARAKRNAYARAYMKRKNGLEKRISPVAQATQVMLGNTPEERIKQLEAIVGQFKEAEMKRSNLINQILVHLHRFQRSS